MYAMKRNILLLGLIYIAISCSDSRVYTVYTPDVVDTLRMDSVALSEELVMPTRMIASCGKVVVYQRKGDDVFVLIEISQGGKCSVIGRKGRGPKEFVGVDVQSIKPVDGGFICMDAGGKEKRISLDGDIEIETASSATFGHPQNGVFVGDEFIAAIVVNGESEYIVYSSESEKPRFVSEYPDWTGDKTQSLPFLYMKNMISHPDKGLFASFYVYFRKIRIYDADGDILYDIDVRLPDEFPAYSPDPERQYFAYASYPCASERYIYALCRNSDRESFDTEAPEIQVWDWSGNLKKRYLPDRNIDLFAVDEEQGLIFGMDIDQADKLYYQYFEL